MFKYYHVFFCCVFVCIYGVFINKKIIITSNNILKTFFLIQFYKNLENVNRLLSVKYKKAFVVLSLPIEPIIKKKAFKNIMNV